MVFTAVKPCLWNQGTSVGQPKNLQPAAASAPVLARVQARVDRAQSASLAVSTMGFIRPYTPRRFPRLWMALAMPARAASDWLAPSPMMARTAKRSEIGGRRPEVGAAEQAKACTASAERSQARFMC